MELELSNIGGTGCFDMVSQAFDGNPQVLNRSLADRASYGASYVLKPIRNLLVPYESSASSERVCLDAAVWKRIVESSSEKAISEPAQRRC